MRVHIELLCRKKKRIYDLNNCSAKNICTFTYINIIVYKYGSRRLLPHNFYTSYLFIPNFSTCLFLLPITDFHLNQTTIIEQLQR